MTEITLQKTLLDLNNPTEKKGIRENTKDNTSDIEDPTKMIWLIKLKDGTGDQEMSSMDQGQCLVKKKVNNSSMNMKEKKKVISRAVKNS